MSKTKWTLGPWKFYPSSTVESSNGKFICTGKTTADAVLIAAAPELYEALEGAVRALENLAGNGPENLFTTKPKLAGEK